MSFHKLNLMGYRVLLFSMYRDDDTTPIMEEILRHRVEALVLVSSSLSSHFALGCQHLGLPVLLLNRKMTASPSPASPATTSPAARPLPIFCWMPATGSWRYCRERYLIHQPRPETGFRHRLDTRGARPPLRDSGMWSIEEAMNATRRLMALPDPPDALFCANDMMAIAALNVVVGEMGMRAGHDISVVGFDDIAMASWPLIDLTTGAAWRWWKRRSRY